MESYILNIINTEPDWREILAEKHINIKESPPFAIFNYGIDVDPIDPVVREARGIIIDLDHKEVVCWPFTRFYNSYEEAAKEDLAKFDWSHCRVEEKVDGSIVKLFHNPYTNSWQWSTNSCINAADANTFSGQSFLDVIKSAVNYHQITFEALDEDMTYIFELVSPLQQIVIKYPKTLLYHIGTRSNITGEEDWRYIGILHPETYHLHTLEDCLDAAQKLNNGDNIGGEGYVVVDRNWRRLKIKSPEYVEAHKIRANLNISKSHLVSVIREYPEEIDNLCDVFPDIAVYYRFYQYKMTELEHDVDRFIIYARNLFEEYNHDRKAVATVIKNHPYAAFGFEALKNNANAKELIANITNARYMKLIPDYKENNIIHL